LILLGLVLALAPRARAGDDVAKHIDDLRAFAPETRRQAAEALGQLGPKATPVAIDALAEALSDYDALVRRAAATSLLAVGEPAVPALAKTLKAEATRARLAALTVLLTLGPQARAATADLAAALKDRDVEVRIYAATALEEIGPAAKDALPALVAAAGDTANVGDKLRSEPRGSVCEATLSAIKAIDPTALEQTAKAALPSLLTALKEGDENARRAAAIAVGELGPHGQPAVGELKRLLADKDGHRQAVALAALQLVGGEGHQVLLDLVRADKTPLEQRVGILRQLRWVRDVPPAAVDALRELVKDKHPRVRLAALGVLGGLGRRAKAAIPELVAALADQAILQEPTTDFQDDPYPAAWALARQGEGAVPALVVALGLKEPLVRFQAARALGYLGRRAAKAVPELKKGLEDKVDGVALECAWAMLRAGADPEEPLKVLDRYLQHKDAALRWDAAVLAARAGPAAKALGPRLVALLDDVQLAEVGLFALAKVGPEAKAVLPPTARLLKSPSLPVRRRAFQLLEILGPQAKPAVPVLIELLKDRDASLRFQAAEVLAAIGTDAAEAVPALVDRLKQEDPAEWEGPLHALAAMGADAKPAVPRLMELLQYNDPAVRRRTAQALGDIGPAAKEAVPALQEALKDDDRGVRAWACYALARVTGDAGPYVDRLMTQYRTRGLWEPHQFRDTVPIYALKRLGATAKKAAPLLLEAARDKKHRGVAYQAVVALGNMGPEAKDAVPGLIELLKDADAPFRAAVVRSLGGIGPAAKAAVPRLTELAHDPEEEVADAAAAALARIQEKKKDL
jgi:HEAT repeat protein